MVIDPALDIWVWATAALLLVVMGARAWVVETGRGQLGRTPATVRVLTGSTVAVLAVLAGLLVMQGGAQLTEALLTGTDPATAGEQGDPAVGDPGPGDPAAPDGPATPGG
ncbi:MAG: hypothetical protein LH603_03225 [Pseudonocardia sp.]|nr:hypothetical protein [Pseudonocardia sp.]